jgi:myo-inositol-1(or 4)-monophosphatase
MTDLRGFLSETLDLSGVELLKRFGQSNNVRMKKDTSLVTDADFASEKIILDRIARYFPRDSVISEEAGHLNVVRTPGQKVWIVDPLDGTTNFANGYPFFSTSIGYGEFQLDGQIKIMAGGIGDPTRQKQYLAVRGEGAQCNGKDMRVQAERPFEQCFLVTGFYYTVGTDLDREVERFRKVAQRCQSIRRDGSAALDLALVAAGVFDCFWERGLGLWDVAAGSLLVEEALGHVSNYPRSLETSAKIASLGDVGPGVSYNIEAEGIIAGTRTAVAEIRDLLVT